MPSYEYLCRECEISVVDTRAITAPAPDIFCEKCGNRMTRVFGLGAVTFNGSGFYSKDK